VSLATWPSFNKPKCNNSGPFPGDDRAAPHPPDRRRFAPLLTSRNPSIAGNLGGNSSRLASDS